MEGRTIVRPDVVGVSVVARLAAASMEGRTIVRPDARTGAASGGGGAWLQWRAGQLSGLTGRGGGGVAPAVRASMEGRTIVRPDRSLDLMSLTFRFAGTCERLRKADASKVCVFCCQAALSLVLQGVERSLGFERPPEHSH